ncbi:hypothetical protein GVAMD_1190 [Gardnerella vaginalis AMD]|nr:hypothetical protein GVAMD_1190 [Gardnerella vaginalis AMD]
MLAAQDAAGAEGFVEESAIAGTAKHCGIIVAPASNNIAALR